MDFEAMNKVSLFGPGAIAAAAMGFLHMACGLRFGTSLILFYLTGSKVLLLSLGYTSHGAVA